jgi:uncharacterized protein (TIGR00369 family)
MNAEFAAAAGRVRAALEAQPMLQALGAVVEELAAGMCILSLDRRPQVLQQMGFFHGGAIAFLIDNATTGAAGTLLGASQGCLTAEYKLNLLVPAAGDRLVCRAEVVKAGRTQTVVEARVHSGDKLVAVALASIAIFDLQARPDVAERSPAA